MARINALSDDRGVVYVEFIIAFLPMFLLFLAICQLALFAAAEAVVRHAAYSAVRSAVVILEDAPSRFDDAPRGSLSKGDPNDVDGIDDLVTLLGVGTSKTLSDLGTIALSKVSTKAISFDEVQPGARMVPIRSSAFVSLLSLAPNERVARPQSDSVSLALSATGGSQLDFALKYTKAASAVTLHDNAISVDLAKDPVAPDAVVTARVTYAYHCTIPVVRAMMCRSIDTLSVAHPLLKRAVRLLPALVSANSRFKLLSATATLPNQGANYYPRGGK
jgi:hypothetical protein